MSAFKLQSDETAVDVAYMQAMKTITRRPPRNLSAGLLIALALAVG